MQAARSRGSGVLLEPVEQLAGRHVEGGEQAQQCGKPDLTYASLDPADLNGGKAALLGEVFLCPAAREPSLAHARPELFQGRGHRPGIVELLSRTGQNQSGKVASDE